MLYEQNWSNRRLRLSAVTIIYFYDLLEPCRSTIERSTSTPLQPVSMVIYLDISFVNYSGEIYNHNGRAQNSE